eukprot:68340_1
MSDIVECEWTGDENNIVVMRLNNAPVNVFTQALFERVTSLLNELSTNDECDAVIIVSKFGEKRNIFAAGLDLSIFAKGDDNLSRQYLSSFVNTVLSMHKFGKPIVFGINGKNIAGGAILAACGDYRIMKKSGNLHYIEAQIGLEIPQFAFDSVERIVGKDNASLVFQTAIPLNSNQCKNLGLVNEVVETERKLMERAMYVLENYYFNASIKAAKQARFYGRKQYIQNIEQNFEKEINILLNGFKTPEVQAFIKKTLQRGRKRPKKKIKTINKFLNCTTAKN